jgi:hypothetical protein
MADDDLRDERLAAWLEPEPLDDVTRRRLVSTAMRQSRDSRAGRWIATAAAIVVVLVVGLALITAQGGGDEHEAATPARTPAAAADSASPKALSTVGDVGNFGDLDQPANLAKLRDALGTETSSSTGEAASAAPPLGAAAGAAADHLTCSFEVPESGTIVASGSGTVDGRRATVFLSELPDGSRSYDVLVEDPCEQRHLP